MYGAHHPGLNFQRREAQKRGGLVHNKQVREDLDNAIDNVREIDPELRQQAGFEVEEDEDDFADGQLQVSSLKDMCRAIACKQYYNNINTLSFC